MTARQEGKRRTVRHRPYAPSCSEGITLALSGLLIGYAVKDPSALSGAALRGLTLAARAVIPSLFPFFVLSVLLSESGLGTRLGRLLSPLLSRALGVSGECAPALLLGAFCGFPVGAKCLSLLQKEGRISERECLRLLPLSNSPSFAFLYSAVGAGYFGDRSFGLLLYLSVLLATTLTGLLLRLTRGACEASPNGFGASTEPRPLPALFTGAIASSVASSLSVAAYVVFFSVVSDALSALLGALSVPPAVSLVLSGLLELSTGTKKAAETVYGLCGRVLCGFFAGFGGLCAALQVIATVEHPLPDRAVGKAASLRSYFFCKVLIGALSALFTLLLSLLI